MKKIITFLVAFVLMISFVNAKEKVKVYMFEAGGCPYCEAEEEYLKGLAGYDKTFKLVKKELFVDHINWEKGKDFELGKKVAEAFNEAGFEDASYEGTPFVVISDLYAAATYSKDLEDIINLAYEEGDRDVVSCIKDGGTSAECIRSDVAPKEKDNDSKAASSKAGVIIAVVGGIVLVGVIVYVLTKPTNDLIEEVSEEKEEKPKRTVRKTTTKKTTKK